MSRARLRSAHGVGEYSSATSSPTRRRRCSRPSTLGIGNAITLEAGLSFLGLGVQPPAASWGSLIASGRDTVVNAPWVGLAPGIALVLVVIGCTLVADAVGERK